jgi:hypothetical protein
VSGPGREREGPTGAGRHEREHEEVERHPLERLASSVGNRGLAALARHGQGVLPDGRAHPDVEAAIASSRGGGRPLEAAARDRFGPSLGDPLDDVRVHTGPQADTLSAAVSARAFAVGPDLFFGEGEYRPDTAEGDRLLAHELTHVVQSRDAPASGPLTVSQPGDALEREADRAADELAG